MTTDSASLLPAVSTPAEVDLRPLIDAESLLIALDFDGVLAPLQDDPETSRMVAASAAAIEALSALPGTRVALVSGRDIATLRRLAAPPAEVWLVGSHGAEVDLGAGADGKDPADGLNPEITAEVAPEVAAQATAEVTAEVTVAEAARLAAIDAHIDAFEHTLPAGGGTDFLVERKPFSRTVHTRGLDAELASALHDHALAVREEFPDIRIIEGHDITELAVKQSTKGDGLRMLVRAAAPTAVTYLGDDVTDEDAFAELESLAGPAGATQALTAVGIKVGQAPTRAAWRIADPEAVAALLVRLTNARASRD